MSRIIAVGEADFHIRLENLKPVAAAPGGLILNIAIELSRMEHQVSMASELGSDTLGRKNMHKMPKIAKNVDIYAVGHRAMESFKKYLGRDDVSCLLYGIPDERPKEKIHFMLSGTISTRKAQDIFVDAIMLLREEFNKKADFTIIGNIVNQEVYDQIVQKAQNIDNLRILDGVSHEEMLQMYENVDVIVCPSREDPMPVVVAEGMMNSKVCIVSDHTGTAKIITDGKDGIICEVSAESLAKKIEWVICNYKNLDAMRENARKLYLKNFSLDTFEKNILKIIEI